MVLGPLEILTLALLAMGIVSAWKKNPTACKNVPGVAAGAVVCAAIMVPVYLSLGRADSSKVAQGDHRSVAFEGSSRPDVIEHRAEFERADPSRSARGEGVPQVQPYPWAVLYPFLVGALLLLFLLVNERTRLVGMGAVVVFAAAALTYGWIGLTATRHASENGDGGPGTAEWIETLQVELVQLEGGSASRAPAGEGPAEQDEDEPAVADRPAWVSSPPGRQGSVYRTVAVSDPMLTRPECQVAIADPLVRITEEYVRELIGPSAYTALRIDPDKHRFNPSAAAPQRAGDGALLEAMGLKPAYIREKICRESYFERLKLSVGEMQRLHLLMQFDEEVNAELQELWKTAVVRYRVWFAGIVGAAIMGIVAVVYSYLKIDTATKGFYTRRLQFASLALILAIASLGYVAV